MEKTKDEILRKVNYSAIILKEISFRLFCKKMSIYGYFTRKLIEIRTNFKKKFAKSTSTLHKNCTMRLVANKIFFFKVAKKIVLSSSFSIFNKHKFNADITKNIT